MWSSAFVEKAQRIKTMIFDVDGVFTDGRIYVGPEGIETKAFYVPDGQGIRLLQKINIDIAIISGHNSPSVASRMQYLGIRHIFQGISDKLKIYQALIQQLGVQDQAVAYMGDDLPDLPVLKRAGLALTVPHAVKEVLACTPFVTQAKGGQGAVREVCELILKAHGKWEEILNEYLL